MARGIDVIRVKDIDFIRHPPTEDVYSPEFDRWMAECGSRSLYDAPLGSETAVHEYWSAPAALLKLPLLASIYEQGFYEGSIWSGEQLDQLDEETRALEQYWRSLPPGSIPLAHLEERAGFLRRAMQIAKENDAAIIIT